MNLLVGNWLRNILEELRLLVLVIVAVLSRNHIRSRLDLLLLKPDLIQQNLNLMVWNLILILSYRRRLQHLLVEDVDALLLFGSLDQLKLRIGIKINL